MMVVSPKLLCYFSTTEINQSLLWLVKRGFKQEILRKWAGFFEEMEN